MKMYGMRGIPNVELKTFHSITALIDRLNISDETSCHLICRALSRIFPVTYVDGFFCDHYEHSWLITASERALIDAWPVAGGSPFIVSRDRHSPWNQLYRPTFLEISENNLAAIDEAICEAATSLPTTETDHD